MTVTAARTSSPASPGSAPAPTSQVAAASRRAPKSAGAPSAWPRTLVALHVQGDSMRLLAARQDAADAAPVVVEAATHPASDTGSIEAFVSRHKPASVVRLISSASTVARCVPVPPGLSTDRALASSALSLLAESEMPAMIPAHRRAAGLIHPGPENTSVDGVLIVGWPQRSDEPSLPAASGGKPLQWTPELVALASLARSMGGAELALYADRTTGSLALVATSRPSSPHSGGMNGASATGNGGSKVVARVLRGDSSSDAAWRTSVQNALTETAASLGFAPAPIDIPEGSPTSLILLGSPMRRPRGAAPDAAWINSYALAFGAICTLADADPAASSLASLQAQAPSVSAPAIVRAVEWLTRPKHAIAALVLCAALFLFWPFAVAKTREMILSNHAGGSSELQKRLKDAKRHVAFYQQLREKRWPMTKLVADISGAAPVGLYIDTLSLRRDQGLNIRGRSDNAELVTQFRANLAASNIFAGLTTPQIESEGSAITFQLEAQVTLPQYLAPRAGDFVKEPLAVRLYGERARTGGASSGSSGSSDSTASNDSTPSAPSSSPSSTPSSDSASRSGSSRRGSVRGGDTPAPAENSSSSSGARRSATANAIPEPLTDADIQKMDRAAAMKEFSNRKAAASRTEDAAIKQRLLDEAAKCQARMQEAAKGG